MNKSVKKIIVTSASLLMMASIGAGVGNLSRSVHAESTADIIASAKRMHVGVMNIDKLTPEQKRDEARTTAWANKVDMNEDIKAHESEGMTRSQAVASIKKFNKEKQARMKKAVAKADHRTTKKRNRRARKRSHKRIHKAKRNATKRSKSRKGFYFSNVWSAALKHNQKGLKFAKQKHNHRLIKNIKRAIKHDKKMLKMSARFSPKSQAKQRKLAAERDNTYENKVVAQTLAQER